MCRACLWCVVLGLAMVCGVGSVWAHQSGKSTWKVLIHREAQEVIATLEMPYKDLARGIGLTPEQKEQVFSPEQLPKAKRYLLDHTGFYNGTKVCKPKGEVELKRLSEPKTHFSFVVNYKCDKALGRVRLSNTVLTNDRGGYQHLGLVEIKGGTTRRAVFDASYANMFVQAGPNDRSEVRSKEAGFHWIVLMFGGFGLVILIWTGVILRRSRRAGREGDGVGAHHEGHDPDDLGKE